MEILKRRSNRYREERNKARKERDEAHKGQNELQKKLDNSRQNLKEECQELRNKLQKKDETFREQYEILKEQQNELKRSYDTAIAYIQSQQRDINELTVEISRSVNTNGTTTRGDDYFEAKFAVLEGAIRQWVFRSFRDIPDIKHQDLLPTVQTSLEATVFEYKASADSKASSKEIEAAIAERLRAHVFHPSFVLHIQDQFYNTGHMSEVLGGTGKLLPLLYFLAGLNVSMTNTRLSDLERREWHARTVGMILRKDHYDDDFSYNLRCAEGDLLSCFNPLLRGDGEEQRRKSLLAIIEQAAKLQVEVFRQISLFRLHQICPGEPYDARLMDDLLSLVDEDEAGTQIFIVRVVVFPPVLRYGFDEDGKFSHEEVVVRKGTVVTMLSKD